MGKSKSSTKKDNTNKPVQTAKLREDRKVRQAKRDAASEAQALRRAAEGNVSWDAEPSKNGTGIYVKSSKGASQSMIRRLISVGKLKVSGSKLIPA
jgi:hypothetical protein